MSQDIALELTITGISGYSPLFVPIQSENDLRMGWVEPVAQKLGNDPNVDVMVNLSTWKIFDDLSDGAWDKFHDPGDQRYFEPVFTPGTNTALAWTLCEEAPLMPGAAVVDQSNTAFAFAKYVVFKGKKFAIDTKSNRVWREDSGTWKYYAGAGTGWTATDLSGNVSNCANNGAGLIRVTTAAAHGMATGDVIVIKSVVGTTEANNSDATPTWTVTVVTATTFDLQGSTFTNPYTSGGTWKADAAGLRTEPTDIYVSQLSAATWLFVGQDPGAARQSSNADQAAPTWSNFTNKAAAAQSAQHFALVNTNLFYSNDYAVTNRTTNKTVNVGDHAKSVNHLEWFQNFLIVLKPEGLWAYFPTQKVLQKIKTFPDREANNGRACIIYQNYVYFNVGETFYRWDGRRMSPQPIALFDGNDNRAFYSGKIRALWEAEGQLFAILRVTTSDATPYLNDFVMVYNGIGWHPVYVATSTTANPSYYVGAVMFADDQLYFSCGTSPVTGYLMTDGYVPKSATGKPYTWGVGVVTGWFDAERDYVTKWIRECKVTTKDVNATNVATLTAEYQRWTDTAWQTFTATVSGTNDNATMTPTAASGLQAGYTTGRMRFRLTLNNAGTAVQKEKMFYVRSFHAVGLVFYPPAFQASCVATLDYRTRRPRAMGGRTYKATTVFSGLKAGITQAAPVTVLFPTGDTFTMSMLPSSQGLQVVERDPTNNKILVLRFGFELREAK